ncbi:MAG TPA: glutathione S-transferase family protein [Rhizomicrobium sp.]|jgi:glutathione S-transferase
MITVYGGWPTRALRVIWLLEELDLPYALRAVDLRNRLSDAEFLAVNPAGFLPAMRDGDLVMVESVAMMEYLIARYGPPGFSPAPADAAFGPYQQFLHLGEAGLAAYLNIVVGSRFFAPEAERDNWGAKVAVRMFLNRLGLVSRRLESFPHMAGDQFTAADISVTYALELGARVGLAEQYEPAITAYMGRMAARDGYRRASAKSPPPPAAG